jgi:predicted ATPase
VEKHAQFLSFDVFRLDLVNERLWRGTEMLSVRPKPFAVLRYLALHAGRLVTKEELTKAIWPHTVVGETSLKGYIGDLREILGDDPEAPRFIETVTRRGYRFLVHVQHHNEAETETARTPEQGTFVGREAELKALHAHFERALRASRQLVFVSGEAGIGKSALVDAFVVQAAEAQTLRIGRGQCVELYGEGEAYMPVLEAFRRLCHAPDGTSLLALLGQHAPTWLAQLPTLLSPTELTQLQQRVQGATRQRMLRELVDALEVLTSDHPLVLVLEDLHWSDLSTLELLAYLARRQEQTRFMVIGTYRPADLPRAHPLPKLTHELHVRGLCQTLPLQPLKREDVATYVATRFPGTADVEAFAAVIHRRTEGNALFMVTTVQAFISQGLMVEKAGRWELQVGVDALPVPESVRQVIAQQLERLGGEERQVLEAASVEGVECTAAAITAAVGRDTIAIEECCTDLIRGHFLCARGISEWPDGTETARFGFVHALYQEVLYEHVLPAKRTQFHRRIGERLAHGYGERTREIAAELALHFARGRDYPRALQYCHQAVEADLQRCAYPETMAHLTTGLRLLKHLPATRERVQHELRLQLNLGLSMMATKGYAAPEAKQAYDRAYELCQQMGEGPHLLTVLRGLTAFYYVRADLQAMRDLAERCLALARRQHDPVQLLGAHLGLGAVLFSLGDFVQARLHLEQGVALYDPQQHIGLLNQLCRRPIPAELCGSKPEGLQKGGEAVFDLGESFIQRKLFA